MLEIGESVDAMVWVAIGTGGAVGAAMRRILFGLVERFSPSDPSGTWTRFGPARATLIVNILGSLLLGWTVGEDAIGQGDSGEAIRAFWVVGVCGALTTFSTLCADAVGHTRARGSKNGALVLTANLVLGIAALILGMNLAR